MDPTTTTLIAASIAWGLKEVGKGILTNAVPDLLAEPARQRLQRFLNRGQVGDKALRQATREALAEVGAPVEDATELEQWYAAVSLDQLAAKQNATLRHQVARSILTTTTPNPDHLPEELIIALKWPPRQRPQLAELLAALRAKLYTLQPWRDLIEYANEMAKLGKLDQIVQQLARLDNVLVATPAGEALRVVLTEQGLSQTQLVEIEKEYRATLVQEYKMHDFRGIVQMRQDIRLPLAEIYLELGLLSLGTEADRRRVQEELLTMREAERIAEEERHLRERRVTDRLAQAQRLVILGEPGAGKTISLRFIALMLAYGQGPARLGLETHYLPLLVRLADFARELESKPALALDKFLLDVIEQTYTILHLPEFVRRALEQGRCLVLLDGLDEVGDDPVRGQSLRGQVVQRVQTLADRWCSEGQSNRLVVTSRLEGYWTAALRGGEHVQLSPLQPPDEVTDFLQRWYTAHALTHQPNLPLAEAQAKAEQRIESLLPQILGAAGVRRLITNPLLLTILALIHENLGKLPNRRVKLYESCAQTLIETWRQSQTGLPDALLADLGEETVIRIMAPLAYWLHEHAPGGTASLEAWQERLETILREEGFETEATEIAGRFLHHARYQAGLLAERGLNQFGFFHLTFEEYLAAREIARQRAEERREMLKKHWADPRWHEVILLAAGQLGIAEARKDDASDFIKHLLELETNAPTLMGRPVVLAGQALADINPRSVTPFTRRAVLDALRQTMRDCDPEAGGQPRQPPQTPIRTRYEAGAVLDELGWLPADLNEWVLCPACADDGGDLLVMKYPVTNVQYKLFINAGGYNNPIYWGGEQNEGWGYRVRNNWTQPRYWNDVRFGQTRQGYPVVGVSWYEAVAYAVWLTELLELTQRDKIAPAGDDMALIEGLRPRNGPTVRLPTEAEWEKMAGGAESDRYPWNRLGRPATTDKAAALARANTKEAELQGTSPVGMYPLGVSHPHGLWDMAGNVLEWTSTLEGRYYIFKGGAWFWETDDARCGSRNRRSPLDWFYVHGFRLVSPVGSVS